MNQKGQDSLEYLLLFAVALVVVIIAIIIWLNTLQTGQNIANNQINDFNFNAPKEAFGEQYFLNFKWARPDLSKSIDHYALWEMQNNSDHPITITEISFEAVGDTDNNVTLGYMEVNGIQICCTGNGLAEGQWFNITSSASPGIVIPGSGGFIQGNLFYFDGTYFNENELLVMRFKFSDGSVYRPDSGLGIQHFIFEPYGNLPSWPNRMAIPYQTICDATGGLAKETSAWTGIDLNTKFPRTFTLATDLDNDSSGVGAVDYASTLSWDLAKTAILDQDSNLLLMFLHMTTDSVGSDYQCTAGSLSQVEPMHFFIDFDLFTASCLDLVNDTPDASTKFLGESAALNPWIFSCGSGNPTNGIDFSYDLTEPSQSVWQDYLVRKAKGSTTFRLKLIGDDLDPYNPSIGHNDFRTYKNISYATNVGPYLTAVYSAPV